MATNALSTRVLRRLPAAVGVSLKRGRSPALPCTVRARLEQLIEEAIEALDALDAGHADMEPDADGEAEPDEASAQHATLAPDRTPAKVHHFSQRLRTVQVPA